MSKLNSPKKDSNMFRGFHTVSPITGCINGCVYCYLRNYTSNMALCWHAERLDSWGVKPKKVFVGSAGDMWLSQVPARWIEATLTHCKKYREYLFLFMTKHPPRYAYYAKRRRFPRQTILGMSLETNRSIRNISDAMDTSQRVDVMVELNPYLYEGVETLVNLEPLLGFDLGALVEMVNRMDPRWISVGAESLNHNLPEPSSIEVLRLLSDLRTIGDLRVKPNLYRLVKRRLDPQQWLIWLREHGIESPEAEIGNDVNVPEAEQLSFLTDESSATVNSRN